MRKLFSILVPIAIGILLTASVFAQAPQKMSYQAVIRNSSNALVTNQQVGMQISILQGSANGTAIYVETQTPTTNDNGLVSIEIGAGTVVSGNFTSIDWANGSYFIKTETDPIGGTNYTITGTSQLLSVPYALHAKTAETVTGGITEIDPVFSAWDKSTGITITESQISDLQNYLTTEVDGSVTNEIQTLSLNGNDLTISGTGGNTITLPSADGSETKITAGTNVTVTGSGTTASPYVINATGGGSSNDFYLGQDTLGGIVFFIYIGNDGNQHGLIVSKTETTAKWQNTGVTTYADRSWDGAYNMDLMSDSPAKDWVTSLGSNWYLPSIDELSILWHNRFHVNKALNDASATLLSYNAYYWSSTEYSAADAFYFDFTNGYAGSNSKAFTYSVRAVRAF